MFDKSKIKYVDWNYTSGLHLIRLKDGRGLLRTTEEMKDMGLVIRRKPYNAAEPRWGVNLFRP